MPQETQPLVGTEGKPEAGAVVLWEPFFPLCIQSTPLSPPVPVFLPLHSFLYSRPVFGLKSLILPMGRKSYSHPHPHLMRLGQDRDLPDAPRVCREPCPHLNRQSLFSFDNQARFVKSYQLFTGVSSTLTELEFIARTVTDTGVLCV